MQFGNEDMSITLFEQQPIRRVWHEGRWFYSVIDMVATLTESKSPRIYWAKLKERLANDEGAAQTLTKCQQLKLMAPDGKQRETDCADVETMLRIIQSIPSPKTQPFKQWLAELGAAEVAAAESDMEVIDNRTEDERRLDYRKPKAEQHKGLHAEIHQRGIQRPRDHATFDVRGHKAYYNDETPHETEDKRGIPRGEGPSWMGSEEMGDTIFRDVQSRAYIKRMDIRGKEPLMEAHEDVSRTVRKFIIEDLGGTPPELLPKADKSIEQAAKDEERRRTKGMDLWEDLDATDKPPAIDAPKETSED